MNGVRGFSTPPIKVSEMRQLLETGRFASWIADIKRGQDARQKNTDALRNRLRFENVIVDHARQPRQYHTWFIVFLLAVIVFCLITIALRSETPFWIPMPKVHVDLIKLPGHHSAVPVKKPEPALTIQHIFAQMIVESHGDHGAISSKGCVGSMQVMPATAAACGISEWELHHPVLGLDAGIRIMKDRWERWRQIEAPELRWAMSLASYNCGHWRAKQFYYGLLLRKAGIQARWFRFLPRETMVYIQKIKANYGGIK